MEPGRRATPTCAAVNRAPTRSWPYAARWWSSAKATSFYLARIFHDLDVEPTNLDYPSLREVIECVAQPDTRSVLVADLEFVREPSAVLRAITTTLSANFPAVRVRCFVPEEAYELLGHGTTLTSYPG